MRLSSNFKWLLLFLPLTYLIFSIIYLIGIKQFGIYNYDPPYAYLLNGTDLASGHITIGAIEHPGTPVDCFAAIVIFIRHLFFGNGIIYQDVLQHPEAYLYTCSATLTILLMLSVYVAGLYVFRHTGNIGLALLFQSSPLFYGDMLKMTVSLGAESGITICGIFFIAYLYINSISSNQMQGKITTNKSIVLFGLFTAILITTKIYCFPIIVLVIFLIPKRRTIVIYLISTMVFSFILLFPLYNQFKNWCGWIKSSIFHSGFYGTGNPGIIDKALYKESLIDIFTKHYLFTFVFIIILVSFLITLREAIQKKSIYYNNYFLPITGVLIFTGSYVLIIAKQYIYHYPAPLTHQVIIITKFYYFILVFLCFPIAITIAYKILSPLIPFNFYRLHKHKLLYSIFVIMLVYGGKQCYTSCCDMHLQNTLSDKTEPFIEKWENTPLIIVTDGPKIRPEVAYFLGISYSGKWGLYTYFNFMEKIYPNSYLYTPYDDALRFWGQKADISSILKKKKEVLIYLNGTDSAAEAILLSRIAGTELHKNNENCTKIYSTSGRYEDIYLLKADTSY